MRQVTNDLTVCPSANEIVIAVREGNAWIDAVHVRWSDVPRLLAALEGAAVEERQLDELITLQGRLGRAHYDLFMCRRHLEFRLQELARWTAFEAAAEERLRALGITISPGESLTETLLTLMDRLRVAPIDDSHGT